VWANTGRGSPAALGRAAAALRCWAMWSFAADHMLIAMAASVDEPPPGCRVGSPDVRCRGAAGITLSPLLRSVAAPRIFTFRTSSLQPIVALGRRYAETGSRLAAFGRQRLALLGQR